MAYHDIAPVRSPRPYQSMSLNQLLSWADIITLHCSMALDGPHKAIMGQKEIRLMKKSSWLVNGSRGELVDEAALLEALKEKHLAGAALDVFAREPYNGPLRELSNIILTPHIGSYAQEARILMENEAVENLIQGLKTI